MCLTSMRVGRDVRILPFQMVDFEQILWKNTLLRLMEFCKIIMFIEGVKRGKKYVTKSEKLLKLKAYIIDCLL